MSFLVEKYAFRPGCCDVTQADNTHADISGPCYSCSKRQTVRITLNDLGRFRRGEYAQDCFPYLSAADREFLISGICGTCWDEMFANPEEDE